MNAINVISPYRYNGTWVFDDTSRGLDKEPFVVGMPAIIDHFTADIPTADTGFHLTFSAAPFPNAQGVAIKTMDESGGAWYAIAGMKGWLCPALLKYFDCLPAEIHFACDAIREAKGAV